MDGNLEKLIAKCKEFHERLGNDERMIIYVVSIGQVGIIKASLEKNQIRCESYHGKNEDMQNARNFCKWKMGVVTKVMIGTSAFGVGIDYSSVGYVLCYGLS